MPDFRDAILGTRIGAGQAPLTELQAEMASGALTSAALTPGGPSPGALLPGIRCPNSGRPWPDPRPCVSAHAHSRVPLAAGLPCPAPCCPVP